MITRRCFIKNCLATAIMINSFQHFSSVVQANHNTEPDIPVLLYHRIGDTEGHLTITPEKFELDLENVREMGYTTITLETFKRFLADPETELPTKPILISFDDGYLDNFMNAYLFLRKYGMTAAFFIITGMVGEEDRLAAGHIKQMAANGMSFGSHTVSHRALGEMTRESAESELILSKAYLEGLLQKPIDFIAYPKGSYNPETGSVACEAGYSGGFSIIPGTCSSETYHYDLKRIPQFSFDGDIRRKMRRYGCA